MPDIAGRAVFDAHCRTKQLSSPLLVEADKLGRGWQSSCPSSAGLASIRNSLPLNVRMGQAAPLIQALSADPSLRGALTALNFGLLGVTNGFIQAL